MDFGTGTARCSPENVGRRRPSQGDLRLALCWQAKHIVDNSTQLPSGEQHIEKEQCREHSRAGLCSEPSRAADTVLPLVQSSKPRREFILSTPGPVSLADFVMAREVSVGVHGSRTLEGFLADNKAYHQLWDELWWDRAAKEASGASVGLQQSVSSFFGLQPRP